MKGFVIETSDQNQTVEIHSADSKRTNVVMVRVDDDLLRYIDLLVLGGLCQSRSEAAALLMEAGVAARPELREKLKEIKEHLDTIRDSFRSVR